MAAAALEHVPFFKAGCSGKRPIPAKGGRSKMPGIRKKRAYAAWVKGLAKRQGTAFATPPPVKFRQIQTLYGL